MLRQAINLFLPAVHPKGSIRDLDLVLAINGQLLGRRPLPAAARKTLSALPRIKVEGKAIKC